MANITRFSIAKKDIVSVFDRQESHIFTKSEISKILNSNRASWRLPVKLTVKEFIKKLITKSKLKEIRFAFPNKKYIRYIWGKAPVYEIIQSIITNSYFSHYTAVFFHNLTEQIPKTIYLRTELTYDVKNEAKLDQELIDRVFQREQRKSKNIAKMGDYRIFNLFGKKTNNLGVIEVSNEYGNNIRLTNIERTLIDISVRPAYSGGIAEVLKAFILAQPEVSINRLVSYLKQINYSYPYHQVIGYYIERTGIYSNTQIELLDKIEKKYDFYLDYAVKEKEYNKKWRLFIPKGF